MFFQAPTRTLPSRLNTPHCLGHQPVLIEHFAVHDIETLGKILFVFLNNVTVSPNSYLRKATNPTLGVAFLRFQTTKYEGAQGRRK